MVKNAQDLMEDMFAVSRENTDDGPLQAYLALSQLDSRRRPGHGLSPETVRLMCLSSPPPFGPTKLAFVPKPGEKPTFLLMTPE